MPVDTPHALYTARLPGWVRCRDCKAGTDAVKEKGAVYLPMLGGQDIDEYTAYVRRALFYPAMERTVEGLTGLVLRKPPELELPKAVEADLADLTLSSQSWESVLLEVLDETITVGRLGILVEYAAEGGTRPYWTLYRAEQIVNWRVGPVRGLDGAVKAGLTRLVLRETRPTPSQVDPFADAEQAQYRVLELVGAGGDPPGPGRYTVQVWRRPTDTTESRVAGPLGGWFPEDPVVPLRRGEPLPEIPFAFCGARHARPAPDKPPLLDLADVNLSHYRSSADLEHGRHWTALPTPWVTGYSGGVPLQIGSAVAWTLASHEARVGMLEFQGTGLAALMTALEHKERLMAILGARLLEGQPMRGETAEAVRLRHAGDSATLSSIVCTVDEALTLAFRWHAWWHGDQAAFDAEAPINVTLNRDFFEAAMPHEQAGTLLTMWQAGGISWETYFYLLQRNEWMRPGVTPEEERALIQAEAGRAEPGINGGPPSNDAVDDEAEENWMGALGHPPGAESE